MEFLQLQITNLDILKSCKGSIYWMAPEWERVEELEVSLQAALCKSFGILLRHYLWMMIMILAVKGPQNLHMKEHKWADLLLIHIQACPITSASSLRKKRAGCIDLIVKLKALQTL